MPLPTPSYALDDSCSTLFNNTLYAYTPEAFQSLSITQGAEWMELEMGVPVTGGVCVKSTPKNDTDAAALYIVGGTSNSSDYNGLQRYTFAMAKWETLQPNVAVTQNRLNHNAVYLNASDSILVFAGSQDGTNQFSTQTFTIEAYEPYNVLSYRADIPPATSPILMQWTESKAVYIGGSDTNTKAMLFSPSDGWVDSNATLASPFYNTSNIKSVVIDGDDSSKTVYTFDMSVSPNSVNRTILIDGDGNPVQNAKPVVSSRSVEMSRDEIGTQFGKRDNLTVADWPAYNGTLAPTSTRAAWSIARDQSGLVVISGGNTEDVLCMFKARDNTWVNATAALTNASAQRVLNGGSTGTVSPTASSTASSSSETSSAAAAQSSNNSDPAFPVKILGAVLGSILGAALILILILFFLRWRRNRMDYIEAGHQRRASGISNEKDAMDFADRGMPNSLSPRHFQGHEKNTSEGSFSSMAILMGRAGHKKGKGSVSSDSSSQFNKKYKNAISKPIPQERNLGPLTERPREEAVSFAEDRGATPRQRGATARRGSTRRSSGWNRYWSGGSAMNILGFGSRRTTYADDAESVTSDYRLPNGTAQTSAVPQPPRIGGQPQVSRVNSGSPTVAHHSNRFPLSREMSGTIERPHSGSSASSYVDDRYDAYSSGVPASAHDHDSWSPIDRPEWGNARVPSSTYSDSLSPSSRSTQNHLTRDFRFPTPPTSNRPPPPQPSSNNDMSWLNLGADRTS